MNEGQKRALHHKRHLIAKSIVINDDVIQELLKRKLITVAILTEMKNETSNFGRMVKYLEAVELSKELGKAVFNGFYCYLSVHHRWLADELEAELNALSVELRLENYIIREAELAVLRDFKKVKRLSDSEKKDIVILVATRCQLYKETFKKRLDEGAQKMEEFRSNHVQLTQRRDAIVRNALKFFCINRARLRCKDLADSQDCPVGVAVRELLDLCAEYLGDWYKAKKEKEKALDNLKANFVGAKLDVETEKLLKLMDRELEQEQIQLEERRRITVTLQEQLESIRNQSALEELAGEKELASSKERLEDACRKRKELGLNAFKLQSTITQTEKATTKKKSKFALLETSRRYGYVPETVVKKEVKKSDLVKKEVKKSDLVKKEVKKSDLVKKEVKKSDPFCRK